MTLTAYLIGLAIACVGGILGAIFFPETEEERRRRRSKGSWWKPSGNGGRYFY